MRCGASQPVRRKWRRCIERGVSRFPVIARRRKLVVDAALAQADQEEKPHAESVWFTLAMATTSGRVDADQRAQLAELLALGRDMDHRLMETGGAVAESSDSSLLLER